LECVVSIRPHETALSFFMLRVCIFLLGYFLHSKTFPEL
jgi:hypothetical protein